jgi:hypothetical protein
MPPTSRVRRRGVGKGIAAALVLLSSCSSQPVGHDRYDVGRGRVVELLNQTGAALPAGVTFKPVSLRDTDREICHRHFLGYAVGRTGTLQPEVTAIVNMPDNVDGNAVLRDIAKAWAARHYRVDRSTVTGAEFPKVRAHVGDYTLIATNARNAPAGNNPMTLYVVGACLRV